jgi:hypothetical protein
MLADWCEASNKINTLIGLGVLTFQGFAAPAMLTSDVLGPEESFTFVPPTTLLPLTITYYLPRLPAPSHDYLPPPTTTCRLPRLLATSHDYLLPTPSPSLHLLREGPKTPLPWTTSTAW